MEASKDISRLIKIMAELRNPETGCPWDIEQNFETIKPYTIEEAYEVADAIARADFTADRGDDEDATLRSAHAGEARTMSSVSAWCRLG